MEVGEKKDRFVDALNATRAAVEEGIVPGGGTALLKASKILTSIKAENFDQQLGIEIVMKAIQAPCRTICENAGAEGNFFWLFLLHFSLQLLARLAHHAFLFF